MTELLETVTPEVVVLRSSQADMSAWLYRPSGPGPHPAIVMAYTATGMNRFARHEASRLAEDGFVVIVPDYYRGDGPRNPDSIDDIEDILAHMATIDFVDVARVMSVAVDYLIAMDEVDRTRIGTWGWCTGATFSLLLACLRPELAGAVMYFPSQPRFEVHDDAHPVDPIDLMWSMRCPSLLIYGDQDGVMPPELLAEVRRRIDAWKLDVEVLVPTGAGHAFNTPDSVVYVEEATTLSWNAALEFARNRIAKRRPS